MTTITVEIDKDQDLSAIKEFIAKLGLTYNIVVDDESLSYTDDIKNMLDKRYSDYLEGNVTLIDSEESKNRIKNLIAAQK